MSITSHEAQQVFFNADCLYDEAQVRVALDHMAEDITHALGNTDLLVMGVMHGGLIVTGELLLRLPFLLHQDYIHATRYRGATSGGALKWIARPSHDITGRTLLIIDDIYDEGLTLQAIVEDCKAQGAHAVYTAVLVNKLHNRKAALKPDFIGLEVADRYVFGYGMDYKGYLRNVPGIYAVSGS